VRVLRCMFSCECVCVCYGRSTERVQGMRVSRVSSVSPGRGKHECEFRPVLEVVCVTAKSIRTSTRDQVSFLGALCVCGRECVVGLESQPTTMRW
jgi:hypothetical protein